MDIVRLWTYAMGMREAKAKNISKSQNIVHKRMTFYLTVILTEAFINI